MRNSEQPIKRWFPNRATTHTFQLEMQFALPQETAQGHFRTNTALDISEPIITGFNCILLHDKVFVSTSTINKTRLKEKQDSCLLQNICYKNNTAQCSMHVPTLIMLLYAQTVRYSLPFLFTSNSLTSLRKTADGAVTKHPIVMFLLEETPTV